MNWVQIRHDKPHSFCLFELQLACAREHLSAGQALLREAHREIARVETELCEFHRDSPVARLNRAPAYELVALTSCVREILGIAERLRVRSGGAFDPLGKSLEPRGVVLVSEHGRSFFKTEAGTVLSFAAIAKSYALDRVRRHFEQAGFTNYRLSAGQSVFLAGTAGPEKPWRHRASEEPEDRDSLGALSWIDEPGERWWSEDLVEGPGAVPRRFTFPAEIP